jgi:hypothetical protein
MGLLSNVTWGLAWKEWLIVVLCGPLVYCIGWLFYARFFHPLAKIPGPLWPSISRTWLMYRMYKGDLEVHMRAMHNRYLQALVVSDDNTDIRAVSLREQFRLLYD